MQDLVADVLGESANAAYIGLDEVGVPASGATSLGSVVSNALADNGRGEAPSPKTNNPIRLDDEGSPEVDDANAPEVDELEDELDMVSFPALAMWPCVVVAVG